MYRNGWKGGEREWIGREERRDKGRDRGKRGRHLPPRNGRKWLPQSRPKTKL